MKPRVSVLLPVYRGEAVVADAIGSIQNQTFHDWELLVMDDGSDDGSLASCKAYAERDDRIRVLTSPANRGLAVTMNQLVSAARGEFLAIQEQDDVSFPDRLDQQVRFLDDRPDVGVVSGIARWRTDTGPVGFPGVLTSGGQYPPARDAMVSFLLVEQCKVVNAAVMFRRRCLPDDRPPFDPDARMSIDWQFFIDVAHRDRFHGLPVELVEMDRTSDRSSLTTRGDLKSAEARRCLRVVRDRYYNDPTSPIDRRLLRKAWASEWNLEGRQRGGRGVGLVLRACALDPGRRDLWLSALDLAGRGPRRLLRGAR